MEQPAKETVIVVHGTGAAREKARRRWYEPVDSRPGAEPFPAKLDAALQERGSSARCWAHCTQGNQTFQWSGENSWVARTHAASALGDYVTSLRNEGWRFHIVAHSHGGNVVVEAMPKIIAASSPNDLPGTIITLGSPFMDTISPILKRARRARKILKVLSWIGFTVFMYVFSAYLIFGPFVDSNERVVDYLSGWLNDLPILIFILFIMVSVRQSFSRTKLGDLYGTAQVQPLFLAIGSVMDEAWQVLHHTRNIQSPLAVRSNLLSYLFISLRSNISRSAQVARIHGAKSYRDIGTVAKLVLAITYFVTFVLMSTLISFPTSDLISFPTPKVYFELVDLVIVPFLILISVLFLTKMLGETFYSVFWSPFRWCMRRAACIGSIFSEVATYVIRNRTWSLLQARAMGLEGYRFRVPFIEQHPSYVPQNFVKYENMPRGAEQRALEKRSAWIARHLGDVSQTFSKLAVTAVDISSLLRTVEEDQTLVHAAYYTDDECIARIADWIAGKG